MAKPNPILASFEAKLRAEFEKEKAQMQADHMAVMRKHEEIALISSIIAANELHLVAEKRSGAFLKEIIFQKTRIAKAIVSEDDPEFLGLKHDLAGRMRQIMGDEQFEKYRGLFPMLQEF